MGRRCSEAVDFFLDLGDGVSGMDWSSRSSWIGSGSFWESFGAEGFLVDLGLPAALGLEAALDPEPLRILEGVPALDPSFGGDFPMAGEDILR